MDRELILIGVWDGDYMKVVGLLVEVNPELKIRTQRKKLVLKYQDYYQCLPLGEEIKVPKIYDDEGSAY